MKTKTISFKVDTKLGGEFKNKVNSKGVKVSYQLREMLSEWIKKN